MAFNPLKMFTKAISAPGCPSSTGIKHPRVSNVSLVVIGQHTNRGFPPGNPADLQAR